MLTVDGPILGVCKNLKLKPANLLVLSIGMSLILDLLSQVVLDFFTFWWVSMKSVSAPRVFRTAIMWKTLLVSRHLGREAWTSYILVGLWPVRC